MADRRPWPSAKPPEAAVSMVVARARALRRVPDTELRAFLIGMRCAIEAATDAASEVYDASDRLVAQDRELGNARAAGAKLAAARIGALLDAAAAECAAPPTRRGLKALLAQMTQAARNA